MNKSVVECAACQAWYPASEASRVRTITGNKIYLCQEHVKQWDRKTGMLNEASE